MERKVEQEEFEMKSRRTYFQPITFRRMPRPYTMSPDFNMTIPSTLVPFRSWPGHMSRRRRMLQLAREKDQTFLDAKYLAALAAKSGPGLSYIFGANTVRPGKCTPRAQPYNPC